MSVNLCSQFCTRVEYQSIEKFSRFYQRKWGLVDERPDLDFWMVWSYAVAYEAERRGHFFKHIDADILAAGTA